MKHLVSTTLFLLWAAFIFAGPNSKFIYHTVEKGETLYSISHQYGMKPAELAQYNEAIGEKLAVKIGQKLRIPAPEADGTVSAPASESKAENTQAVTIPSEFHIVRKGETVFSISKMYEVSKTDLLAWNKIKDNTLAVGQKLIIKGHSSPVPSNTAKTTSASGEPSLAKADVQKAMKKDGYLWTMGDDKKSKTNVSTASGDVTASASTGGASTDMRTVKSWKTESASERREINKAKIADPAVEYESLYYQNVYSGMPKRTETGVAKFISDNVTTNIAYYNNAAIGTILKLTNTDNGKTTYAIVVGKVAETEENSYLMKLSGRVERSLAAKDYSSIEIVCYTGN